MTQEKTARANQCRYVKNEGHEIKPRFATLTQRLENWIFILLESFFLCSINDITKSHVMWFMAFSESV